MIKTRLKLNVSETVRTAATAQRLSSWLADIMVLPDASDESVDAVQTQLVKLIATLNFFTDVVVLRRNSPFGMLNQVWFEVVVYNADETPTSKNSWVVIFDVAK